MEENPFVFGKAVEGSYFTNRTKDTEHLEANLTHGINTILISPRRWGKTSLVKKVMANIVRPDIKIIYIDVFSCKSEYDFYKVFASTIIQQTSSKIEEWITTAKEFLSRVITKVAFSPDSIQEYSLSFEFPVKDDAEDILQLPERIAQKKGIHIVLCLDEFQQVAEFQDSMTFQKKLRSVWQHQQKVSYCLFGSKRHLMTELFSDSSNPFYKFGDMMFLKKIPTEEWIPFICHKFQETCKVITEKQAERICKVTEDLSSYVQHLSWIVWYKAKSVVTYEMVEESIEELLEQNKVFFQREVEGLTELQLNLLKAIANGVDTGFTKKEVIKKYHLESSANVQGIKKSLLKKDLIDIDGSVITYNDPLFKLWIKKNIPNI
ncbi:MAG: ATP-binding protein [Prevotella sp.]|nr:ATP-binding protein [Prevotella sp.]